MPSERGRPCGLRGNLITALKRPHVLSRQAPPRPRRGRPPRFFWRLGWMGWGVRWMRISNLGLSVCLFYDVVVPKPPSEREVAAEGRRKEPYGTNASGEENNCILRKMLKQHPSKPFLHALSSTRFAGAPSRREPWIRGCLTRRQTPI